MQLDTILSKECSGCLACLNICPVQAITQEEDAYGFIIPKINKENCIYCGACERVCEFINPTHKNIPLKTLAGFSKNKNVLKCSTSGGVFFECAKQIIEKGGVVYGCAFSENFTVCHIRVERLDDLKKIQGSKYVQSAMGTIYHDVKRDLEDSRLVLFSGTPCEIAGVKHVIGDKKNLFTIEVICHGVPSQRFFNDYLLYESKKHKKEIVDFHFRDKRKGWRCSGSITFKTDDRRNYIKYINISNSYYYYYYYLKKPEIYRESCYICPFARTERCADLTLGDYWRVERKHHDIDSKNGVSLILINSIQGNNLIAMIKDAVILYESELDYAKKFNKQLSYPTTKVKDRNILIDWSKLGVDGILRNFHVPLKNKIAEKLKDILPYKIKRMLKIVL
ncbi:MAG: Coenzyme F420 hydrogenase/dehydrogenase, beta subunit C-terminal domain [Bacteroidales bacterium]|jgi:coenzyme F420-reducing hydrogenase beta subunit|nr:Coenzyme F420 hydrogenase/dehydrogenase, beta subunit C-terminal domain [Bacteroidales bacterium]